MPATQPGSLSHDDYTDIMAYVLAQNGFPAGSAALTFDAGTQSQVPLLYHGP
jgi:polar amino acid transport system substrate-binding protein